MYKFKVIRTVCLKGCELCSCIGFPKSAHNYISFERSGKDVDGKQCLPSFALLGSVECAGCFGYSLLNNFHCQIGGQESKCKSFGLDVLELANDFLYQSSISILSI